MKKFIYLVIVLIVLSTVIWGAIYYKNNSFFSESVYLKLNNVPIDCDIEGAHFLVEEVYNTNFKNLKGEIVLPTFNKSDIENYKQIYPTPDSTLLTLYVKAKYSKYPHNITYHGCTGAHKILIEKIISVSRNSK